MVEGLIDDKTVNESIIHTLLNDYSLQEAVSIEKSFDYLEKNYFLLRMSLPYMIGTIYLENYYQEKPLSLLMV